MGRAAARSAYPTITLRLERVRARKFRPSRKGEVAFKAAKRSTLRALREVRERGRTVVRAVKLSS